MKAKKVEIKEKMCGGDGFIQIEHLLNDAQLNGKCKMFATVTINKDSSLGYHEHHGNTETYYIVSGEGLYNDNGTVISVSPGDVLFCKDGNGHGLKNSGTKDLVFVALIINS